VYVFRLKPRILTDSFASLLEHGGIYLDIDTFILRPFADHSLLLYDTVMGMESRGPSYLRKPMSDDEMAPKGLCNAIIVARKGALFLERWLESYEEFRESRWTEHSVVSRALFEMRLLVMK
jgi:mannosyltransferase OCH1-like enzyme